MRFLIDQNLPVRLVSVLEDLGQDADHVKLLKMDRVDDRTIWSLAAFRRSVVISKDKDFLRFAHPQGDGQFVHLDVGNLSNTRLYAIIREAWPAVVARLEAGDRLVEVRP